LLVVIDNKCTNWGDENPLIQKTKPILFLFLLTGRRKFVFW